MAMLNYLANHMGPEPEPELVVAVPEWNSGSSYILEQMRCLHLCFQRCRIHFWGFQNPKMSLRPPSRRGVPLKKEEKLRRRRKKMNVGKEEEGKRRRFRMADHMSDCMCRYRHRCGAGAVPN